MAGSFPITRLSQGCCPRKGAVQCWLAAKHERQKTLMRRKGLAQNLVPRSLLRRWWRRRDCFPVLSATCRQNACGAVFKTYFFKPFNPCKAPCKGSPTTTLLDGLLPNFIRNYTLLPGAAFVIHCKIWGFMPCWRLVGGAQP